MCIILSIQIFSKWVTELVQADGLHPEMITDIL
jgi:hypothetical protein